MNTHPDGGHKEHKLSGNTMEKEHSSAWPAKGEFLEKEESAFHSWGAGGEGTWLAQESESVSLSAVGRGTVKKGLCLYAACS